MWLLTKTKLQPSFSPWNLTSFPQCLFSSFKFPRLKVHSTSCQISILSSFNLYMSELPTQTPNFSDKALFFFVYFIQKIYMFYMYVPVYTPWTTVRQPWSYKEICPPNSVLPHASNHKFIEPYICHNVIIVSFLEVPVWSQTLFAGTMVITLSVHNVYPCLKHRTSVE